MTKWKCLIHLSSGEILETYSQMDDVHELSEAFLSSDSEFVSIEMKNGEGITIFRKDSIYKMTIVRMGEEND